MTNREKLMSEMNGLDNRQLMDALGDGSLAYLIDEYACADCKAEHGGECRCAEEDDGCCGNGEKWLDMPCRHERLLDMEATA